MPLRLPDRLPAIDLLKKENIFMDHIFNLRIRKLLFITITGNWVCSREGQEEEKNKEGKPITISKTINVTIVDNTIASNIVNVETKNAERIIIGEDPETSIDSFLDKIDNPRKYLEIYDKEDTLIEDYETMLTTGMKVKLVVNSQEYDEAIVVIRGDIDEDGMVKQKKKKL